MKSCLWCHKEIVDGRQIFVECNSCCTAREWMESDPPRSLQLAAKILSHLYTKHNKERGKKCEQ